MIEEEILDTHFNTNYAASWLLVRGGVLLDRAGNLRELTPNCGRDLRSRNSTRGPLSRSDIDSSDLSAAIIPLLGDAGVADVLSSSVGKLQGGTPVTYSMTGGPICRATVGSHCTARQVPEFAASTPKAGPDGWWLVWAKVTLQDYSQLAALHRGACNVLFADGSVRSFTDENGDGFINNGFAPFPDIYTTSDEEMKPEDMASGYSLIDVPDAR